jgi:hypothetical protein
MGGGTRGRVLGRLQEERWRVAATDGGPLAPGALDLLLPLRAGQRPAPPIGWMDGWVGCALAGHQGSIALSTRAKTADQLAAVRGSLCMPVSSTCRTTRRRG